MAKYKLQEMPDMQNKGKKRVYPKLVANRALQVIEQNGYICLTDYASINNLSRTVASMDLKEITDNPSSPIQSRGNGTHKIWIKRRKSNME